MVRMCRLAPTMATLILAPWEFWLSCKNWDRGGNTDLCHSQEAVCVCGAAGGRWVTRRLQGSDPLDLWPNSISPASLDHHYQTLSLRLSRIANLGGKTSNTHTSFTHFASFCTPTCYNRRLIVLSQPGNILRKCKMMFGRKLMLQWCLVAMGLELRSQHKGMTFLFGCVVTYCDDTNYPQILIHSI